MIEIIKTDDESTKIFTSKYTSYIFIDGYVYAVINELLLKKSEAESYCDNFK